MVENHSNVLVYGEMLSVDSGCMAVSAGAPLQCNWLQIFGNSELEEVENGVMTPDEGFEERACSDFCNKSLYQISCHCKFCHCYG